jgi:hypothetical protein
LSLHPRLLRFMRAKDPSSKTSPGPSYFCGLAPRSMSPDDNPRRAYCRGDLSEAVEDVERIRTRVLRLWR